jgi:hypothetical protein
MLNEDLEESRFNNLLGLGRGGSAVSNLPAAAQGIRNFTIEPADD